MQVERIGPDAFTATFESERELRDEYASNLSHGGLRLPTSEQVAMQSRFDVTLYGPWGGEVVVQAMVVAALPDGIALAFDADPGGILNLLLAGGPPDGIETENVRETATVSEETPASKQTAWDRVRALSRMERLLLAPKAERGERAILIQDSDPRVLLSLLRNPRLTVDEVVRIAKSSFLNFQIADVIMKGGPWIGNLDVRLALIHNAKTPPAFALRILPTLPDSEVRGIARGGTSMALKQAALRQLQRK